MHGRRKITEKTDATMTSLTRFTNLWIAYTETPIYAWEMEDLRHNLRVTLEGTPENFAIMVHFSFCF